MKLRAILWFHFAVVVVFALVSYVDSGGATRFQVFPSYYESLVFRVFLGVLVVTAMVSLFACPIAVLILVALSKASAKVQLSAVVAEALIVIGQVIAIIPAIQ